MKPIYIPGSRRVTVECSLNRLLTEVPWLKATPARQEYFMAPMSVSYTYGKGRGARTYTSSPLAAGVGEVMALVNRELDFLGMRPINVCFLNYYRDAGQHLGWHADDHEGTDHTAPIAVVSYGAEREIWWRKNNVPGIVPPEDRQLLGDGSLFIMPPGFQSDNQHRIPKGDRAMGARVSLTFRAFLGIP